MRIPTLRFTLRRAEIARVGVIGGARGACDHKRDILTADPDVPSIPELILAAAGTFDFAVPQLLLSKPRELVGAGSRGKTAHLEIIGRAARRRHNKNGTKLL